MQDFIVNGPLMFKWICMQSKCGVSGETYNYTSTSTIKNAMMNVTMNIVKNTIMNTGKNTLKNTIMNDSNEHHNE